MADAADLKLAAARTTPHHPTPPNQVITWGIAPPGTASLMPQRGQCGQECGQDSLALLCSLYHPLAPCGWWRECRCRCRGQGGA